MQCHYSEIEGHILAHRAVSRRPFSFDDAHAHPLKQGLCMLVSLILLMSSMGLMYLTVLFVSDIQQHTVFCQHASMEILDREFKGAAYPGRMQGQDNE